MGWAWLQVQCLQNPGYLAIIAAAVELNLSFFPFIYVCFQLINAVAFNRYIVYLPLCSMLLAVLCTKLTLRIIWVLHCNCIVFLAVSLCQVKYIITNFYLLIAIIWSSIYFCRGGYLFLDRDWPSLLWGLTNAFKYQLVFFFFFFFFFYTLFVKL